MLAALQSMAKKELPLTYVGTAKLYLYDENTNTQLITDFRNSVDMKAYLTKYGTRPSTDHARIIQSPQSERLGTALGIWLHDFHDWAGAAEQAKLTEIMRKNPMAASKHHYTYGSLVETIPMFPDILKGCEDMFRDLEARNRKELESGAGQLIHGDFWTGKYELIFH